MSIDIYKEVSDQILLAIEAGKFDPRSWVKNGLPANYASKKAYHGINTLILGMAANSKGWSNRWMTYKQATDIGAKVRKGEKGTMVVFFKPWQIEDKNNPEGEKKTVPMLRKFVVFNESQIDGLPVVETIEPVAKDVRERLCAVTCESILSKAKINIGGDQAFYRPSTDEINMPEKSRFNSLSDWYATALHELTHWTSPRLKRGEAIAKYPVNERYAREELVAELGSAFLSASIGFEGLVQSHASYLNSWAEVIKNDSRAIFRASAMAQKAADFIMNEETDEIFTEEVATA